MSRIAVTKNCFVVFVGKGYNSNGWNTREWVEGMVITMYRKYFHQMLLFAICRLPESGWWRISDCGHCCPSLCFQESKRYQSRFSTHKIPSTLGPWQLSDINLTLNLLLTYFPYGWSCSDLGFYFDLGYSSFSIIMALSTLLLNKYYKFYITTITIASWSNIGKHTTYRSIMSALSTTIEMMKINDLVIWLH